MVGFTCPFRLEALLARRVYRYPSKPGRVALDEISMMGWGGCERILDSTLQSMADFGYHYSLVLSRLPQRFSHQSSPPW